MCATQTTLNRLKQPKNFYSDINNIGGRVLTIEVSTHADVGDINMHCTAIFGKARQGAVYEQYTHVIDIFHLTSHCILYMSLDLQYDAIPWEPNAQKGS